MMKMKSVLAGKLDLSGSLDQLTMLRFLYNKRLSEVFPSVELKECGVMLTL